jgi:hypothetical protein
VRPQGVSSQDVLARFGALRRTSTDDEAGRRVDHDLAWDGQAIANCLLGQRPLNAVAHGALSDEEAVLATAQLASIRPVSQN